MKEGSRIAIIGVTGERKLKGGIYASVYSVRCTSTTTKPAGSAVAATASTGRDAGSSDHQYLKPVSLVYLVPAGSPAPERAKLWKTGGTEQATIVV
jgi:hypothetical protein